MSNEMKAVPTSVKTLLPRLDTYTYLPVTMAQFETLTNEILRHLNEHMKPNCVDGDYCAQILMSVIHSMDRKDAKIKKQDLFDRCLVNVSRHVTYHAVEEIQKRLKATGESVTKPIEPNPADILPDEVRGQMVDTPPATIA